MRFTINKKRYTLKATWQEMTLRDAVKLVNLSCDEKLIEESIQMEGMELNDYMLQAVAVLSDCPLDVLKQTEPIHVVVLFDHVRHLIHGLYNMNLEKHVPETQEKVTFKGKEYYFPESLWITDKEIPMHKEPSKHVTEAGNVLQIVGDLKEKGIEKMNVFCAIYLKESKDEFYDEKSIARRADLFQDLPMNVVWDVFFCMYFSLCSYAINSRASLERPGASKRIKNIILGFLQSRSKVSQGIKAR
jgi:YHS domain-containing protein